MVDLSDYLTDEEKSEYIDAYLKEGDFSGDGSIKIFPVAKSTELLLYRISHLSGQQDMILYQPIEDIF